MNTKIDQIIERNKRVEAEKAWETSWTRKSAIAVITFLVIAWILFITGTEQILMWSVISTAGFLLSTTTLKPLRKLWEKYKLP